jgi:hypothetical protein
MHVIRPVGCKPSDTHYHAWRRSSPVGLIRISYDLAVVFAFQQDARQAAERRDCRKIACRIIREVLVDRRGDGERRRLHQNIASFSPLIYRRGPDFIFKETQ